MDDSLFDPSGGMGNAALAGMIGQKQPLPSGAAIFEMIPNIASAVAGVGALWKQCATNCTGETALKQFSDASNPLFLAGSAVDWALGTDLNPMDDPEEQQAHAPDFMTHALKDELAQSLGDGSFRSSSYWSRGGSIGLLGSVNITARGSHRPIGPALSGAAEMSAESSVSRTDSTSSTTGATLGSTVSSKVGNAETEGAEVGSAISGQVAASDTQTRTFTASGGSGLKMELPATATRSELLLDVTVDMSDPKGNYHAEGEVPAGTIVVGQVAL